MCQSRGSCFLGMTPSNYVLKQRLHEDSKRAGRSQRPVPASLSLPMASGAFKRQVKTFPAGEALQSLGACKQAPEREVPLYLGAWARCPGPLTALPGVHEASGVQCDAGGAAWSPHPQPTSSSSSWLAQPDAVFPGARAVGASARLGAAGGTLSGSSPAPAPPLSPPSCPASRFALTLPGCSAGLDPEESSGSSRIYQQDAVEIPVAHMPDDGSWGREQSCGPGLPPALPHAPRRGRSGTCEVSGLQVLFSLHQDPPAAGRWAHTRR